MRIFMAVLVWMLSGTALAEDPNQVWKLYAERGEDVTAATRYRMEHPWVNRRAGGSGSCGA